MDDRESSGRLVSASRVVIAFSLIVLATAYDKRLWLAASEPRWMLLHFTVLLAGCLYFWGHIGTGLRIRRDQPWPVWWALLFGLSALLSMVDSFDLLSGWWTFKHVMACMGLFGLVVALRSERWYWQLAWVLTLSMAFNGALGVLQFHGIDDQRIAAAWPLWGKFGMVMDYFAQRAVPGATFINKNAVASYLVLTVPIAFAVFLGSRSRWAQVVAVLCLTLGATLLIYSRTRSSWLGASIAICIVGFAVLRSRATRALLRRSLTQVYWRPAAIAAGLMLLAIGLLPPADNPALAIGEKFRSISDVGHPTYAFRWAHDVNSVKMAVDHPLNGIGLGAFRSAYPLYHSAWVDTPSAAYDVTSRWNELHNDWLQTFAELGVPGGIALIAFFLAVGRLAWKSVTGEASQRTRLFALFSLLGIAGLCIDSLANFPLQLPTAGLVWCLAGCVTGVAGLTARQPAGTPAKYRVNASPVVWVVSLLLLGVLVLVSRDDLRRWESGYYLTIARRLNHSDADLDSALSAIERAYAIYPYNAMVHETRALTYARDVQMRRARPEKIIEVIEESLRYDAYSSYLLITLGKLYTYQGLLALRRGDATQSSAYADKTDAVLIALRRVESRRAELPAFAAYVALLNSEPAKAIPLFEDAMKINPTDPFVAYGANLAQRGLVLQNQMRHQDAK